MYLIQNDIPDLIYTNSEKKDIGVIKDYVLDVAYGNDENSFELKVPRNSIKIESGSFVYLENTEYGGIVDSFSIDTEEDVFVYSGRTWHGILETKVVIPPNNEDYLIIDEFDANIAIARLLQHIGLSDFTEEEIQEDVTLYGYKFEDEEGNIFRFQPLLNNSSGVEDELIPVYYKARYVNAYETLKDMLNQNGLKLKMVYPCIIDGKKHNACQIYAEPLRDYSTDDEWQMHNTDFLAKRVDKRVNHLICLGQGDLKDRYVLNLYADENGGIVDFIKDSDYMPAGGWVETGWIGPRDPLDPKTVHVVLFNVENGGYYRYGTNTGTYTFLSTSRDWLINHGYHNYNPEKGVAEELFEGKIYRDSEYILDSEYVKGLDDVSEVFDYPNADFTEHYIKMKYMPLDYGLNFQNYFELDGNNYKRLTYEDEYRLTSTQPQGWSSDYGNFYIKDGDSYRSVSGINQDNWGNPIKQKPEKWSTEWSNYSYKTTDGVNTTYKTVEDVKQYEYKKQTVQPTDWENNYKAYFNYQSVYVQNKSKTFVKNKVFRLTNGRYVPMSKKPPGWNKDYNMYFVKSNKYVPIPETENDKAPKWNKRARYTYVVASVKAPNFSKFKNDGVYQNRPTTVAPTWTANTYYEKVDTVPAFKSNQMYELSVDHYAELAKAGVEKLLEYQNQDVLEVNLPVGYEYDVGDIVGTKDDTIGLSVVQPITKKIVKIDGIKQDISYQIGGN